MCRRLLKEKKAIRGGWMEITIVDCMCPSEMCAKGAVLLLLVAAAAAKRFSCFARHFMTDWIDSPLPGIAF